MQLSVITKLQKENKNLRKLYELALKDIHVHNTFALVLREAFMRTMEKGHKKCALANNKSFLKPECSIGAECGSYKCIMSLANYYANRYPPERYISPLSYTPIEEQREIIRGEWDEDS